MFLHCRLLPLLAGLIFLTHDLSARGQSVPAPASCDADEECERVANEAREHSQARRFDAALRAYAAAYARRPDVKLLFNIGRVLHKAGRPAEAAVYYQLYLDAGADGSDEQRRNAQQRLDEARREQLIPVPAGTQLQSPPVLIWGVHEDCTRLPKIEQALTVHLSSLGEHLLGCPALNQVLPALAPCSGIGCVAQLPSACKQTPARLFGAEIHKDGVLTRLRIWLTGTQSGLSTQKPVVVQDACVACDDQHILELLIARTSELTKGHESIGGICSPQAVPEAADPGTPALLERTLLVVDVAEKERVLRAIEPYLSRLGNRIVAPQHPFPKSCSSQECLNMLAQSNQEQGVTKIFTISSEPQKGTLRVLVYDTQTHRAEQSSVECEGCEEPQVISALVEVVGQLAVRCLREHCPPPHAGATPRPEGACAPLPLPQCGGSAGIARSLARQPMPTLGRRIGAGGLIGTGVAVVAGSLGWSLVSRTSLSQSLSLGESCDFMGRGALSGNCQITNYGGVDIAGYFVGAAGIVGGVLLLKLPLQRRAPSVTVAEKR